MKLTDERKMDGKKRSRKQPGLILSLIPFVSVITLLLLSLTIFKIDIHIPLIMGTVIAAFIASLICKISWKELEQGIFNAIGSATQAILIACIIGLLIGSWIMGGIVPTIIYYGLKILEPKIFLVACLLICSLVGVATGSSWTTAGTIGIALIGIGGGIGIPAPVTAGACISGAYFGDKMSPLSDTTNLAPAMSGATIFNHIRHMVYTTGCSYLISIVAFQVINIKYLSGSIDSGAIDSILATLTDNFYVSPLLLIPPLFIIAMVLFRISAIPALMSSVGLGIFCGAVFQGTGLSDIGDVLQNGFTSETGNEMIDDLLSRGGLQSIMWTVSLILCSLSFGGVMESSGMMRVIAGGILRLARSTGSLILATLQTSMVVIMATGEQYLSLVIAGGMYKDEYRKRGLAPENLSRALEDSGTLISPLIPWSTCAVAMSTYLGVATVAYLPFCVLNLVNPVVSAIYGFTGLTIKKLEPEESGTECIVEVDVAQ